MLRLLTIVTATAALSLSACSSQPSVGSASGTAQVASANSQEKCEVDARRVCQELRNKPVINSATGLSEDATEREQNFQRTASEFEELQIPNGSLLEVQ